MDFSQYVSVRINYAKNLGFENGKHTIECELDYDDETKLFWGKCDSATLESVLKLEEKKQKKALYLAIKDQLISEIIEWQEVIENQG